MRENKLEMYKRHHGQDEKEIYQEHVKKKIKKAIDTVNQIMKNQYMGELPLHLYKMYPKIKD